MNKYRIESLEPNLERIRKKERNTLVAHIVLPSLIAFGVSAGTCK